MPLFQKMNQHAMIWIRDMMSALRTDDEQRAMHALRAGLQALRDRLSVEEAAQLSAQLPLVVRGMFFEGWDPSGKPLRIRHRGDFLALVQEKYGPRQDFPTDDIVSGLFRVLSIHVSPGELTDVVMSLPSELCTLVAPRLETP
jgi:uncharacterized protein (DUF2267 family)